jgi:hypothetical protein
VREEGFVGVHEDSPVGSVSVCVKWRAIIATNHLDDLEEGYRSDNQSGKAEISDPMGVIDGQRT